MPQAKRIERLLSLVFSSRLFGRFFVPNIPDVMIRIAIREKKVLGFHYKGLYRIVEPHVYGNKNGDDGMMTFLIGGQSSSGFPHGWRRMYLKEITGMRILDRRFPGRRPASDSHSMWDYTYCIVGE